VVQNAEQNAEESLGKTQKKKGDDWCEEPSQEKGTVVHQGWKGRTGKSKRPSKPRQDKD